MKRVAFDCMPPVRKIVLEGLVSGQNLKTLGIPPSTLSYAKGDLEAQGLLEGGGLSPLAKEMLEKANLAVESEKAA